MAALKENFFWMKFDLLIFQWKDNWVYILYAYSNVNNSHLQEAVLSKNSQISAHREKIKTWIKDQGKFIQMLKLGMIKIIWR